MKCQGVTVKDWGTGKEVSHLSEATKIKRIIGTSPKVALKMLLAKQFYYSTKTQEVLRVESILVILQNTLYKTLIDKQYFNSLP